MKVIKRILLVEDDPKDVELTLTALAEHKLANEVIVARDGAEALDYLLRRGTHAERTEGNPAVVLLDLKMPKVSGLEVLQAMRSEPAVKSIPVVMLTSSRESKDLAECYAHGANAYVVKPVRFTEFVASVKDIGVFWVLTNEPPPGTARNSA